MTPEHQALLAWLGVQPGIVEAGGGAKATKPFGDQIGASTDH